MDFWVSFVFFLRASSVFGVGALEKTTCNRSITGLVEVPRGMCLFFVKVTRGWFVFLFFLPFFSLYGSPA